MTDRTPAAQTSEPRTAAGRRLHARIFGLSDRMPDGAELDNLILAIEAEAADHPPYPTPDEFAGMTQEQFVAFLDRIGVRRFAAPAGPDVVEALRRALPHAVNFRIPLAAPVRDPRWDEIAAELAAALPAAPAGLDDLLHRVDEAIGGAPGMYVAGYGGSMIGRDHAVRVVSDALRAAYAEGKPEDVERCAECGGVRCPTCGQGCIEPIEAHAAHAEGEPTE